MTDTQKLIRIYAEDGAVRAMAVVAAVGVTLAASRGTLSALWLFVLGWSLYVLEEYLIHRFIFHAPAPQQQFLFDLLYRLHYGHHDQVRNKHLLFTPLWFALPMSLLTVGILWLVLPFRDAVIAVLGGGVCAYLAFEWLHLTSHFRMTKGRLGRYITRRHARHHNVDHNHWYTVSPGGQLVDSAFGSDPAQYSVVPNVQTCGLDPDDPRLVKSRLRFGLDASLLNSSPAPVRAVAGQAV
jgi:fatty acid hydroxylase family protein